MKTLQDPQSTGEAHPSSQVSYESQDNQHSAPGTAVVEPASVPSSNSENKKVSREDIELVQNLIERCLQLYLNKGEVVSTLSNRARIEPGFTSLVWQKLEEENSDFFRAYYIRLKLKKQIILFNYLLEHQYHLMKYPMPPKVPLAPMQNGIHPVTNLPMGYPVLQQPPMPATGHPHLDSMGGGVSSCHVVNGIPAPGSYHPIRMNSGNEGMPEAIHAPPPCSAMSSVSEMAMSPASVASSNHFPFTASELSGMGIDAAALDTNFASDVTNTEGLQLGPDGGVGSSRSLGQLWNLSLSDLTADLENLGDLGALGDYTGSLFLPSESDILLDSPDQDDLGNSVDEFFADTINGDTINGACSQSDEDKP